ncbi:MAG: phosphoenolpyruvate--protein phosphotransferase [Lachnospiraceae bacterium]|nr:phosphoenolpyruvate--protein phosphotransferase [Lachnospiraceae bacterium]MDE6185528.1 phosphoenolpyruvate--protein phosphotransferase [Lachnospiraceae bacterium]
MKTYVGKSVYHGIAIGQIQIFKKEKKSVYRSRIEDVQQELAKMENAVKEAKEQLKKLYEKALLEVGESGAAIFEVHQMMLDDQDYQESIQNMIQTQQINAEYAVAVTADNFANMFAMMDDAYMKERAADVRDISERLISILTEAQSEEVTADVPTIILADDLSPSETVQMDKSRVNSFVTRYGSANSHTAILARTMNVPAIIGLDYDEEIDGKKAIVDGFKGELIVEPTDELLAEYEDKAAQEVEKKLLLLELKGKETVTLSGREIRLYANIGGISDLQSVMLNDAAGIGLFRSEFLYLEKDHYPTEEEQFQIYRSVAETMAGKKVIIRTLDIGADKQISYFGLEKEENPAMGYRAIRICLKRVELFKTQLRALYRASAYGNIGIMFPMIISVKEVKQIKEIVEEVKAELKENGILYGEVELGIMIETPAAVMISEDLAKEVDFFSIGTNDLTQYTLAIDRQNAKLDDIYDSHHPAVLKMIQMTVENGHKGGAWVGICGELGADLTLTDTFVEMGVDELSVSPACILPIRKKIRDHR